MSEQPTHDGSASNHTTSPLDNRTLGPIRISCPQCRKTFRADAETDLTDLSCPSCGSRFSIVSDYPDETTVHHRPVARTIAQYDLIDEVGRGGFGRVWLAQDKQLDRVVALKIPHEHRMQSDTAEWFFREARAAAQLQHPNIVRVFEIGRDGDRIYIASEFIRGVTLANWLSTNSPSSLDVARMCMTMAEALQHAHGAGIIHRDLKPSNILIDRDNQPKITDFGLAKRESGEPTLTIDGKLLGTPAYMSPEQALGMAHHATGQSDIFSLGVILFEMLTLVRPFRGSTSMVIHQVIHVDPPPVRNFNKSAPLDLEAICLKCLEKEPSRRYATMADLAADLKHFLQGEPVSARRVTRLDRGWRWCKRNRVISSLAGSLLVVLAAGLASTTVLWQQAVSSAQQAIAAYGEAEQSRGELRRNLFTAQMENTRQAWMRGDIPRMRQLLSSYIPQSPQEEDLREFVWHLWWGKCQRFSRVLDHGANALAVAFSADGKLLASAGTDRTIRLWDLESGILRSEFVAGRMNRECKLAFSNDGQWLASTSDEDQVLIWSVSDAEPETTLSGGAMEVGFAADSQMLYCVNLDGTVRCVQTENWQTVATIGKRMSPAAVGLGTSNQSMAIANRRGTLFWMDLRSEQVKEFESEQLETVWSIAISPDSSRIASAGYTGVIRILDTETGDVVNTLNGHVGPVGSLSFSPDGSQLVSACNDGTAKVWRVASGELMATYYEHIWAVSNGFARFSNDGRQLASASSDGTVKVWDVHATEPKEVLRGHEGRVETVCFTRDSQTLISGGSDHTIRYWDSQTGVAKRVIHGHSDTVFGLDCSPDGNLFASASNDATVRVWSIQTTKPMHILRGHEGGVLSVAFSADGTFVASGSVDKTARVWSAVSGESVAVFSGHGGGVRSVVFLGQSGQLATGCTDGAIRIWNVATGQLLRSLKGHRGGIRSLTLSVDGKTLASGSEDRTVILWDLASGQKIRSFEGLGGIINSVAFCADGKTLASGGLDRVVRLFDLRTGETKSFLFPDVSHKQVHSVAFSFDGMSLAAGSLDQSIRIWRAAQGYRTAGTLEPSR